MKELFKIKVKRDAAEGLMCHLQQVVAENELTAGCDVLNAGLTEVFELVQKKLAATVDSPTLKLTHVQALSLHNMHLYYDAPATPYMRFFVQSLSDKIHKHYQ